MNFKDISLPQIYKESMDFRTLLNWFALSLTGVDYDTTNFLDLYDPLRCKSHLLWMLGWTMGFKFDDRLPIAYNRLVMLYFMNMLRYKGSKTGITIAAELNIAQFNILDYGREKDILYERLEDTSIPVNAVYVNTNTQAAYIDVVYFTDKEPIDACLEYVRPLGMYIFQHPGVRFDARTKITIDARLTNISDIENSRTNIPVGYVAQYTRDDYARMQKMENESQREINMADTRQLAWYRNSTFEETPTIDPGWRTLYSLEISNNEHIVRSLIDPIFDIQYGPQEVSVEPPDSYLTVQNSRNWNLGYNKDLEEHLIDISKGLNNNVQPPTYSPNIATAEVGSTIVKPIPRVNPIMRKLGDAIPLDDTNTRFTEVQDDGRIIIVDQNGDSIPNP